MKDLLPLVERLTELMENNDLSVNKLSKKIKCDNKAIARWFKCRYYPRPYVLVNLAKFFNRSIDFLLGLSDEELFVPSISFETFHDRLRICMKRKTYTAYRVAKICDIGQSTVSQWINFGKMPETTTLISLSECFGCSVNYLLGITDSY